MAPVSRSAQSRIRTRPVVDQRALAAQALEDQGGGGLLGLGIGPDLNLGLGTLFNELAGGVTGLARLGLHGLNVAIPGADPIPGTAGADFSEAGKGIVTSLAGTLATPAAQVAQFADVIGLDGFNPDEIIEGIPAALWGDEYKGQDVYERIADRGLLPALAQTIGDISLAGSAATAPLKVAGIAAKAVGATETAASLAARAAALESTSLIHTLQHPYRTAGEAIRSGLLEPAAARVEGARGILPEGVEAPGALRMGDEPLAAVERRLRGREVAKIAQRETRAADQERLIAGRSETTRSAVAVARDRLIEDGKLQGIKITRHQASAMVGEELHARLTGTKLLGEKAIEAGIPEDVVAAATSRKNLIPEQLLTPELDAALADATDLQAATRAKDAERLAQSTRHGDEGLQDAETPVQLTKAEQGDLATAAQKLERASSAVLDRKIAREVTGQERLLTGAQDQLQTIDRRLQAMPEEQALAAQDFHETRPTDAPMPGRTIAQEAANPPALAAPTRPLQPLSEADRRIAYKAGRTAERTLARLEKTARERRALAATKLQVMADVEKIRKVLDEGLTPSQVERRALLEQAAKLTGKVSESTDVPSLRRTPARWQPVWHAVQELGKEAEKNPALAEAFAQLPQTLGDIQELAARNGFDPVHVADMTPAKVRRMVFANMRLGLGGQDLLKEATAGTRKSRTGALAKAGGVSRSIESFLAATVETTIEARTNAVIDAVETQFRRTLPDGAELPEGWSFWNPTKNYLLTGTKLSDDALRAVETAAGERHIVPKEVISTLKRYSSDYDHWAFRAVGRVTSPWRTLMLTMSPGWYARNILGNVVLATMEGVRLQDWTAAWDSYKTKDEMGHFADIPFVPSGALAHDAGVMSDGSIIPRHGIREAGSEVGRVRGAGQELRRHMVRVNEVVDEFARAAVYHRSLNKLNMTSEQAWARANEAMVDYSNLSSFERNAVRAVVPFYSWQKGILKVTTHLAIDHPARVGLLLQLGQLNDEYMADRYGVEEGQVPQAYNHMLGSWNFRSFNPFSDPASLLSPEGITASMNPFIELGIRKGLGAPEFFPESYRLGNFGQRQADVNVPDELSSMFTGSPAGRLLGITDPAGGPESEIARLIRSVGGATTDTDKITERLQRTAAQLAGEPAPSPSQGIRRRPILPPRG